MTWTSPFTAVTGATITAAGHNTSVRDNLNHLRALVPDAGGAGLPLVSATTTTAAFGQLGNAGLADNAVNGRVISGASVTSDEIADGTITATEMADGAISYAKAGSDLFKQGKVATFSGTQALTTSYVDASGVTFTCDRDGQWLVIAMGEFGATTSDGEVAINIVAGGVQQEEGRGPGGINLTTAPASCMDLVTISGSTTVKSQVKKLSGSGGANCYYVKLVAIWLAP